MADEKITQLSALTASASGDLIAIVDVSASETKKMTVENLFKGIPVDVGINTATVPAGGYGAASFAIKGTDGGVSCPAIQLSGSTDDYPEIQLFAVAHDDINLAFDAYWGGAWASSDAGSQFLINKASDQMGFYGSFGNAAGAAVSWTKIASFTSTEFVINDSGVDRDFRIESDINTHAFFVRGSDGFVGIGTDSPDFEVEIFSTSNLQRPHVLLHCDNDQSNGPIITMWHETESPAVNDKIGQIKFMGEDDASNQFNAGGIECRMQDPTNGDEASSLIFRVAIDGSDSNVVYIKGYNGVAAGQAEFIINADNRDVDFQIDYGAGDGAFKVQGSDGAVMLGALKTGATQVAAGAAANEIWATSGHATLPDNVLMIGV